MSEWQEFSFGVESFDGDRVRFQFPHPVVTGEYKARNFGIQEYDAIRVRMSPEPSVRTADLHSVAVACFLADKYYRRDETGDGWTRRFKISIPVIDPGPWRGEVGALFMRLLEFLTADRWRLEFQPRSRSHIHQSYALKAIRPEPARAVSLFSGGLDSFCHNAIVADSNPAPRLLVGHSVPHQVIDIQKALSDRLPGSACELVQFKVEPHRIKDWSTKSLELSQRTRTLLFMTTALLACDSEGVSVLEVPENGLLALNPPLNVTRVGAHSTKSAHPMTLYLMNRVLHELGTGLRVDNPVGHMTKGELCRRAADVLGSESLSVLSETVSCFSMMPNTTRDTQETPNCGSCYPCLIRHASLETAGRDKTRYAVGGNPARVALPDDKAGHRRALRRWLREPFGAAELLASSPLPPTVDMAELTDVIQRSRNELRAVFGSK